MIDDPPFEEGAVQDKAIEVCVMVPAVSPVGAPGKFTIFVLVEKKKMVEFKRKIFENGRKEIIFTSCFGD